MTRNRLRTLIREVLESETAEVADVEKMCRRFSREIVEFFMDDAAALGAIIDDVLMLELEKTRSTLAKKINDLVFTEVKRLRRTHNLRRRYNGVE